MELWLNRILRDKNGGIWKSLLHLDAGMFSHCSGCANQHMWPFNVGEKVQVECLVSDIVNTKVD